MPLFDYLCPVCGVVDEVYVPGIHTEVLCEECCNEGNPANPMERMKFGGRSVFDVKGWNSHNGYGLRWADNPHDIKMRGLT
jgi:hypothetical protein